MLETSGEQRLLKEITLTTPLRLVEPDAWVSHIPFAYWLVTAMRPRLLVELGTHIGNSYSAFAHAVQLNSLDTRCYAVDTWRGDPHAGEYGEEVFSEWSRFHDQHFGAFSRLVRATFDEAVGHFTDGTIDLLHIDGLHTYEAVRHDFQTWQAKLSSRAVVLFHDTNVRERDFGVYRLWEELRSSYPSFEFMHGHGLGILAVGPDQSPDLHWLTHLEDIDHARLAARFFSAVGDTLRQRLQVATLERESADLTTHLRLAIASGERHREDVSVLTLHLEEATRSRSSAESECASLRRQVEALTSELGHSRHTETEVRRDIEQYSARLSRLRLALARQSDVSAARQERLIARVTEIAVPAEPPQQLPAPPGPASPPVSRKSSLLPWGGRTRGVQREEALPATPADGGIAKPLFDPDWYAEQYPDTVTTGPARLHYVHHGGWELRNPHPLFDARHYVGQARIDASKATTPLAHYLKVGWVAELSPHPLFDPGHYESQKLGGGPSLENPLLHYLQTALAEFLDPHPLFCTRFYVERNPELGDINPLVHFVRSGASEARAPHPLFDISFYWSQRPDVRAAGANPLRHYLEMGLLEDVDPHPTFDTSFYLEQAEEVRETGINPLVHFLCWGWREGLRPNAWFNPVQYLDEHPDLAGQNLFLHFVQHRTP